MKKVCLQVDYLDLCVEGDIYPSLIVDTIRRDEGKKIIFNNDNMECVKYNSDIAVMLVDRHTKLNTYDYYIYFDADNMYYNIEGWQYIGVLSSNTNYNLKMYNLRIRDILFYTADFVNNNTLYCAISKSLRILGLSVCHITRCDFAIDFLECDNLLLGKYDPQKFIKLFFAGYIKRVNTGAWRAKSEVTKSYPYAFSNGIISGCYFGSTQPKTQLYCKSFEMETKKYKSYIADYWIKNGLIKNSIDKSVVWRFELRYSYKRDKVICDRVLYAYNNDFLSKNILDIIKADMQKKYMFEDVKKRYNSMQSKRNILLNLCNKNVNVCNLTYCKLSEKSFNRLKSDESDFIERVSSKSESTIFDVAVSRYVDKLATEKELLNFLTKEERDTLINASRIIAKTTYYKNVKKVSDAIKADRQYKSVDDILRNNNDLVYIDDNILTDFVLKKPYTPPYSKTGVRFFNKDIKINNLH